MREASIKPLTSRAIELQLGPSRVLTPFKPVAFENAWGARLNDSSSRKISSESITRRSQVQLLPRYLKGLQMRAFFMCTK
jgi:hypothetical protein